MAEFILLEPSCDIHLAVEGLPEAKRALVLRVLEGNGDAVPEGFKQPTHFQIQDVLVDPEFDFFPLDQAIVRFDNAARSLTPLVPGTVYMQVRYSDPVFTDFYHYLVARIQVHKKINGWWFGNKSLSVFKDNSEANSQPSIYALFDKDEPGGGVVADITGHNYVELTVDNPAICRLDTSFPDVKFRDRLRGLSEGGTTLKGALMGQNRSIPVSVVNLRILQADPLRPVLKREAIFDATVTRAERHNILFLAEGFTGSNQDNALFDQAVTNGSRNLFNSDRHAPYPLLKDQFNVWRHQETSKEAGLTVGPPLNSDGVPIPPVVKPADNSPTGAYRLAELIQFVGLPVQADTGRSVAELKAIWNAAGSLPRLIGYQDQLAVNNVVEEWKKMVPRGLAQAVDSFYGIMQGRRLGDRNSVKQKRSEMISPPPAGDPDFVLKQEKLGARMFEWYKPDSAVAEPKIDPRRYAPENNVLGDRQFGLLIILKHIAKFADGSVAAGSVDHDVGKWWHPGTAADPNAITRQINSAGLVCLLLNSEHTGGVNARPLMLLVSVGGSRSYTKSPFNNPDPNIRPLELLPKAKLDLTDVVNKLAHEFGHSFNLGDEYEVHRGGPGNNEAEASDNLTAVATIQVPPPPGGHNPDFPTPIDPAKIKWARVHRIAVADMLVQKSSINGGRILARLSTFATDADRAKWEPIRAKWQRIKEEGKKVFLRKYKGANADRQQLPIDAADLYADLTIESVNPDGTISLSGHPAPLEFPAGSVLYMLKRNKANNPLTVVEPEVLQFMGTTRWKPGDNAFPLGVALTENHNKNAQKRSDDPTAKADNPPDIPNYKKPCKGYKLIGLYEGGGEFTTNTYRAAGACKMRNHEGSEGEGEFCFLCKYLIVNRVDPSKHPVLDERFYPKKKKWWG